MRREELTYFNRDWRQAEWERRLSRPTVNLSAGFGVVGDEVFIRSHRFSRNKIQDNYSQLCTADPPSRIDVEYGNTDKNEGWDDILKATRLSREATMSPPT